MLNKEEFEILNSYPLYQFISVNDYITDFVIKNPQNYPITGIIISNAPVRNDDANNTLKDFYDRQTISKAYKSFKRNISESYRIEDCRNFTSTMIMFDHRKNEFDSHYPLQFAILEKINDGKDFIIICKSEILNYYYIFDTNYNMGLICIADKDYLMFVNECFEKTIDYDNLPCDSYKFFTKLDGDQGTKEDYFTRYEIMMSYITGKVVLDIKKQTNFTPLQTGEHSLLYIMQSNNSNYCKNVHIDQYLVKTEKKARIVKHPEFNNSDPLFYKKIATEYTD